MSGTITLQIGGALDLILRPPPPQGHVVVTARFGQFVATAIGDHMAYTLPVGMFVNVQVAYVDSGGNPATIDGLVAWSTSDATVATVTVDANDSTQCAISAVGAVGDVQVTASADADLGAGVKSIVTLLDVTVVAGEAVAGTISVVGAPQPIVP